MDRLIARRSSNLDVGPGTDRVLVGISLPSDSVIHDIRCKIVMSNGTVRNLEEILMYGVEAYILPVHDPDNAPTYDSLWDTLVPKDTDVQTMDLDTGAQDTTPFFEPGEADWTSLFDVGLRPELLFGKYKFLNAVENSILTRQDNQTPFVVGWFPGDVVRIHIRRRLKVANPSALVVGFASPATDDTVNAAQTALAENEWGQVKYIGHVLQRALLHVLGVVEAGAETPWEEATALLQKHLDPDMLEETGNRFVASTFNVTTQMTVDHSVVGELAKQTITTGR